MNDNEMRDSASGHQISDNGRRLEKIENKIDSLSDAISRMANQGEQIAALWKKMDNLQMDNLSIQRFQAACPRHKVSEMWRWIIGIATIYGLSIFAHIIGSPKP